AGEYDLRVLGGRGDLRLSPEKVVLLRNGRQLVEVRRLSGFVGQLRRLEGHDAPVLSLALSPDGSRALSGSDDETIRLWDLQTGQEVGCFRGHEGTVRGLAFSPDGSRALSGGDDHTVRLWDVASRKQLRCFPGHTDRVRGIAFSPDGRRALSGSHDRTMRLWD